MNRYQLLHATSDITVARFDHPPHEVHGDPEEEVADKWGIAFVAEGAFELEVAGSRRALSPGSVLLTRPGLTFRCRHTEACPTDVCLSIGFDSSTASDHESAWTGAGWAARESAPPRLAHVHRRLARAVADGNPFELERWALAALSALGDDTQSTGARGPYTARASDLDAVIATCRAIEVDPTLRRAIADRARDVGMTSAGLSHAFRRYVGLSPHRYVLRWRMLTAADMLASGEGVSATCYRSGFDNLSHFCRTFQRTYGTRASRWRALTVGERQRRMSMSPSRGSSRHPMVAPSSHG